jgi:Mg2+-importing ATPase
VNPQVSLPEFFSQLQSHESGLASSEAALRLASLGPNDPQSARRQSMAHEVVGYFANPLVLILLLAALVSGVLGDALNASIIVAVVLLSVGLNFVQSYRSQQAAERLRAQVAPTATALRDGEWVEVARRAIVPGDVVRLSAGDLVPADARLLSGRDLHVQQGALTGESLPVEKTAVSRQQSANSSQIALGGRGDPRLHRLRLGALPRSGVLPELQPPHLTPDGGAMADVSQVDVNASNLVFLGTSVVSGTATAMVFATGRATMFGDIATRLAARHPETEFERGTRQFGLLIMRTVIFLVLFVFLVSAALHRDPLQSFLFAVALAVGLTPEFLPMITTITLGRGALRMAEQKVIMKHLAAIQNFGSMDVLCSDKTGTLTSGEMRLYQHLDYGGGPSERVFLLAYLNSVHETGVPDAANAAILQKAKAVSPLDMAILSHDHPNVSLYRKLDEVPFDFERRRQSVVVEAGTVEEGLIEDTARSAPGGSAREGDGSTESGTVLESASAQAAGRPLRLLISKGAPEGVLGICSDYERRGAVLPLDETALGRAQAAYQAMSGLGYRVLAVAYKHVPVQSAYDKRDETAMTLAGFITFFDPPLPDAGEAIRALRADGVSVKILTGDNELVAKHVCAEVGLDEKRLVLGDALDNMTDAALAHVAEETDIFARVSPAQKNRIILALKRHSHVVGYLGDGINDAPSLHAADVGISVANAVDVAKDAADIILLENRLEILHSGIGEGRRAFGNVMKYLLMGTSSNFGNMFSMAGASLFLPFLPMLPTQILLNNFLYDLAQVSIPTDNVDAAYTRRPHRWDIGLIRDFMLWVGPVSSLFDFATFGFLLFVLQAGEKEFHTGWFVESLATQTLVLFVIRTGLVRRVTHMGSARSDAGSSPSEALVLTVLAVVVAGVLLPYSPLAGPLGFVPLPWTYFVFLALATVAYLGAVEWVKRKVMGRMSGGSHELR